MIISSFTIERPCRPRWKGVGFIDIQQTGPGVSTDPLLRGLEMHGRVIGNEEANEFETMVGGGHTTSLKPSSLQMACLLTAAPRSCPSLAWSPGTASSPPNQRASGFGATAIAPNQAKWSHLSATQRSWQPETATAPRQASARTPSSVQGCPAGSNLRDTILNVIKPRSCLRIRRAHPGPHARAPGPRPSP
jgi:hypothetical protein